MFKNALYVIHITISLYDLSLQIIFSWQQKIEMTIYSFLGFRFFWPEDAGAVMADEGAVIADDELVTWRVAAEELVATFDDILKASQKDQDFGHRSATLTIVKKMATNVNASGCLIARSGAKQKGSNASTSQDLANE